MGIRKKSLAVIITVSIVVVLTIFMALLGALINTISANRWKEQLHFDEVAIANQLAVSLALPLWNFDYAQIDKIMESAMQNKVVFCITVTPAGSDSLPFGKVRDNRWHSIKTDKLVTHDGMLIQERDLLFANEKIGTVTIVVTQKFLEAFLQNNRIVIFAVLTPILGLMALLLYFVLWRLVVRPLQEVDRFAAAVSSGQKFSPSLLNVSYSGELENVRQSIENMVAILQSRNRELLNEIELRNASEERFRMLFERNPAPILIYERETRRVLASNEAFLDFYGFDRDEVLTLEIDAFFSGEEISRMHEVTSSLADGTNEMEWCTCRKDGTQITAIIRSSGIIYQKINARIATITDITERRRLESELHYQTVMLEQELAERQAAQEALQQKTALLEKEMDQRRRLEESERKLLRAVEQSPVSIVITAPDGSIEFVNSKFTQVTGYDMDELLGQNPRILKTGHTSQEEYQCLWATITSGKVWEGELLNKKKNGDFFWEYATISPIKSQEGIVTNYLAIKEDITDRKQLEEQLRQSQKMESIGRLAGGVAHDFNNMLSVILGAAQLSLPKVAEDSELGLNLKAIKEAAERSSGITRQLLAFSRKEIIVPKPVNLNSLIIEAEKNLGRLIGEDVTLTFKPATGLWTILADPSQLDQILMNLSVNARDAMPDGGNLIIETANVHIDGGGYSQYHPNVKPGDYVLLTVSDTGHGMDSDTLKHVFEPFFTTKAVGKGTGLGLATVYGIVTQNSGFINVHSEFEQGAVFRIYLPRLPEEVAEPELATTLTLSSGTGTILLVEDEEILLWMTTKMLEQMGYTVIQAQSPQAALAICEKGEQIDLILTDVVMPEMNGRAMIDMIKLVRPGIKALFMSGYTSDIVAQRGVVEHGMHFIQKPFNMQQLSDKVREAMAGGTIL